MGYIPQSSEDRKAMLDAVGVGSCEELYSHIPASLKVKKLAIPEGKSELEVSAALRSLADKNKIFRSIFRGAGAYNHYIPAIVGSVTSREEFVTAYTPYQPEISQGILRSIFEFQTMICSLTGMDASNASVYDGATAAAEALAMCRDRKRTKALVSAAADPKVIEVMRTYSHGVGAELVTVPAKNGRTDIKALEKLIDAETCCFYLQQPNFFGNIEDAEAFGALAKEKGITYIMSSNPIYLAIGKTPAECGADIAVGEAQPLGLPLSFGGPYLGYMAASGRNLRKLPGRIVGKTTDADGRDAFVLTLQAREQHIRREKSSSNICSNQAHCALTASVYMAAMGAAGLCEVASQCHSKAAYARKQFAAIPGFEPVHKGEFFHEFVTACPIDPAKLMKKLEKRGILGGLPVEEGILWCFTEMNSKADIDELISAVKEALEK